jgi:hypothetical protein
MNSKTHLTKERVLILTGVIIILIAFSQLLVVQYGNVKINRATTNIAKKTGIELLFDPPLRVEGRFSSYFSHETKKLYVWHSRGYQEEATNYLYDLDFNNEKITLIEDINISNLGLGVNNFSKCLYFYNNCLNFIQGTGIPLLEFSLTEKTFQNSTIIYPSNLYSELSLESDFSWELLGLWQNKLIFAESIKVFGTLCDVEYKHYIGEYSIKTLELIKRTEIDFWIYNSPFLQDGIIWFIGHDVQHISHNQLTDAILMGYSLTDLQISQVVRDFTPLGSGSIKDPVMDKGRKLLSSYSIKEKTIAALYRFIGEFNNEEYGPTERYNPTMIHYLHSIQFYYFTEYDHSDFIRDLFLPIFGVIGGSGLIIFVIFYKFLSKRIIYQKKSNH